MRLRSLHLWREYLGYFREHRLLLAAVTLAGMAQSFTYIPLAALLRRTFDVLLPARDRSGLAIAIGELLAIQLAALLLAGCIRVTALRISHDVLWRLRRRSIERLYDLPRSFHTGADLEHLHVTLVHETNYIESMNCALTAQVLPASLAALVLFSILFWIEPRYAVIIAFSAPALFTVNRLMTRHTWFRQDRLRRAFEEFSRGVRFALSAMDLTRAQASEPWELARQHSNSGTLRRVSLDLTRFDAIQHLLQNALLLASTLAVLLAGGWAVAAGRATRGEIMAFYVVAALFATQARTVVEAVPAIRMGMRAFAQLDELMQVKDREPYAGGESVESIESLRADCVTFAYPGATEILRDVSLEIRRGECVALVGPNGAGKSTLLLLLSGFYRPASGTFHVNGLPYDQLDMRSLRGRIGFVPQHPFLFADTLFANLTYGQDHVSEPSVWEALRWAGAESFVAALPEGLWTPIGEQGVRLSGGQRQRLVIARALLRRPDLLILDEPTNHLDEDGVALLMDSLERLPFRPAILMISHEERVLRHAKAAWLLAGGRLERSCAEAG